MDIEKARELVKRIEKKEAAANALLLAIAQGDLLSNAETTKRIEIAGDLYAEFAIALHEIEARLYIDIGPAADS